MKNITKAQIIEILSTIDDLSRGKDIYNSGIVTDISIKDNNVQVTLEVESHRAKAFSLLKNAGIKRTSYNIIGLPNETEDMIIDTIKFNTILEPDNITVAFFSPYLGTNLHEESKNIGDFNDYEYNVDNQLRTVTKSSMIDKELLNFYKKNFAKFVREGLGELQQLKSDYLKN